MSLPTLDRAQLYEILSQPPSSQKRRVLVGKPQDEQFLIRPEKKHHDN
jgi:hypothetical protein